MKRTSALHSAGTGGVSFIQCGAAVLTALWGVDTSYVPKTYMIVLANCCTSSKKSYLFLNFFHLKRKYNPFSLYVWMMKKNVKLPSLPEFCKCLWAISRLYSVLNNFCVISWDAATGSILHRKALKIFTGRLHLAKIQSIRQSPL